MKMKPVLTIYHVFQWFFEISKKNRECLTREVEELLKAALYQSSPLSFPWNLFNKRHSWHHRQLGSTSVRNTLALLKHWIAGSQILALKISFFWEQDELELKSISAPWTNDERRSLTSHWPGLIFEHCQESTLGRQNDTVLQSLPVSEYISFMTWW